MKHIKKILIIGGTLLACVLLINKITVNANTLQEEVAAKIIRFHVIANSDSDKDQELKLQLRDYISTYMKTILDEADSIEEAKKMLSNNIETIKSMSQEFVELHGEDGNYKVDVSLEKSFFPVKTYGEFTFPSGEYEALKIVIGKGQGKNWWCVMYPNLCFVDESYGVVEKESKELLKKNLSRDAYNMLTASGEGKLKIKSLIWDKLILYLNI